MLRIPSQPDDPPKRQPLRVKAMGAVRKGAPWGVGAFLITVILVVGGVVRGNDPLESETTPEQAPMLVSTVSAAKETGYEVPHEFVGRLEASRESKLSMELPGLVTEIRFDEGDSVAKGDVIATLDIQRLRSRRDEVVARFDAARAQLDEMIAGPRTEVIEAARAEVAKWEAQCRLAEITEKRNRKLIRDNAVSLQQFDDSTYQRVAIEASVRAAKAQLLELENGTRSEQIAAQRAVVDGLKAEIDLINVDIGKSTLLAPYSGVVSARFVDEGTVIASGRPIVQLLQTDEIQARIGVSGDALETIRVGARHQLWTDGVLIESTVRAVRPDRSQSTRTVSVLFTIDDATDDLHVGDLVTLRVAKPVLRSGFWVPVSSLTENYRGLWAVLVATELAQTDGGVADDQSVVRKLEMRELEILHQTADRAFVRGTLAEGDQIVASGTQRVVPGQTVRLEAKDPIGLADQRHADTPSLIPVDATPDTQSPVAQSPVTQSLVTHSLARSR